MIHFPMNAIPHIIEIIKDDVSVRVVCRNVVWVSFYIPEDASDAYRLAMGVAITTAASECARHTVGKIFK